MKPFTKLEEKKNKGNDDAPLCAKRNNKRRNRHLTDSSYLYELSQNDFFFSEKIDGVKKRKVEKKRVDVQERVDYRNTYDFIP